MQPVDKIWMNGEMIPWDEARIHVLSHVIHYGYGVFEGIRAYEVDGRGAIFRLEDHVRRLDESAHILRLENPYSRDEWAAACRAVVDENGLTSAYIRPMLGVGYGALGLASIHNPSVASVAAFEWGAYLGEEGIKNGIRAKVSSFARSHVNSHMLKGKINGMYVNNVLAKREAIDLGYDEAIMLDTTGHVVEASGENLFVVRDGVIATPPVSSVLAGITRDTAMTIIEDMGYEVIERHLTRDELYIADEIFMCGTAAEVTPVREVDDREVGLGKPGPITTEVQERYFAAVRGELADYEHWLS
jgi:branched-chain amino acid aminotransferase